MDFTGLRYTSPNRWSHNQNMHQHINGNGYWNTHFSGFQHQTIPRWNQYIPTFPPPWLPPMYMPPNSYEIPLNQSTPERSRTSHNSSQMSQDRSSTSNSNNNTLDQSIIDGSSQVNTTYPPYPFQQTGLCPCCMPGAPLCPCKIRYLNLQTSNGTQTDSNVITTGKYTKQEYTECNSGANKLLKVSISIICSH